MKLPDFLQEPSNRTFISERKLKQYEDNLFMCEKHEIDLKVKDGFRLEYCDVSYDPICFRVAKENPHAVWFDEGWEKLAHGEWVPAKLVYCPICEKIFHKKVKDYWNNMRGGK